MAYSGGDKNCFSAVIYPPMLSLTWHHAVLLHYAVCSTHCALGPAYKAAPLSLQKDLVRRQESIWNQKGNERRTRPYPGEVGPITKL